MGSQKITFLKMYAITRSLHAQPLAAWVVRTRREDARLLWLTHHVDEQLRFQGGDFRFHVSQRQTQTGVMAVCTYRVSE